MSGVKLLVTPSFQPATAQCQGQQQEADHPLLSLRIDEGYERSDLRSENMTIFPPGLEAAPHVFELRSPPLYLYAKASTRKPPRLVRAEALPVRFISSFRIYKDARNW